MQRVSPELRLHFLFHFIRQRLLPELQVAATLHLLPQAASAETTLKMRRLSGHVISKVK